ncbi:MAG: membrane protein insertion efficiency factor YidD [Tagaea sp.]|nr:membrane protein insertion efficiency factor YidD [Tagaea sp.]
MIARILDAAVVAYQWTLRPVLGANCRYLPSCSDYAREALAEHGAARGTWLAARRVCRCHPWGGFGFDPVPPRISSPPNF